MNSSKFANADTLTFRFVALGVDEIVDFRTRTSTSGSTDGADEEPVATDLTDTATDVAAIAQVTIKVNKVAGHDFSTLFTN